MLKTLKHFFAQFFVTKNLSAAQENAEEWLYQHASKPEQIELGLERCKELLKRLKLSRPDFTIVTVAGTNGKGSTVQFLDSLLRHEKRHSVGRFTSPHLLRFNERIVIDGKEVSDAILLAAFHKIQTRANGIHLTYFEYATLAALLIFAEQNVDVAVLEVGLGGRLDATNAIDADIAVITNIALDHQDWLGDDIELIAREKAGIMRFESPVILAEAEMPESLHAVASEVGANIHQLDKSYRMQFSADTFSWESLDTGESHMFLTQTVNSLNPYQFRNLAAAVAALVFGGFEITQDAIVAAIQKGTPNGRMQEIEYKGQLWLLDVAHNPASMQTLCEKLTAMHQTSSQRFNVVFGMLADKDTVKCVELLQDYVATWFVAPLDSPRSLSEDELKNLFESQSRPFVLNSDIATACEAAAKQRSSEAIVVCGSFYTVADALKYMQH